MKTINQIEKYHILESTSFDSLVEQIKKFPYYTLVNIYHIEHTPNQFVVFYAIIVEYSDE